MRYYTLWIAFFFLTVSEYAFSQKLNLKCYQFPDTIPGKYIFDIKKGYDITSNALVEGYKKRDIKRFAEMESYGKQELFTSGYTYLAWDQLETYLNKVLNQTLPDSLKDNTCVHVYLVRDAEYNAFAIHDGSLFFNIGLFADVVNEAGLAIVLAHEFSHYINNDVKTSYLKGLKIYTKKNRNDNTSLLLKHAKYDRASESRADSLGFVLAENGGYDIFYGISNFMQFREIENFEKETQRKSHLVNMAKNDSTEKGNDSTISKSLEDLMSTHPDLSNRISFLNKYINSAKRRSGKQEFIIDKDEFSRFQELAKTEVLNILLTENKFKECIKRSFIYYLLNPDNENYIYYLLESIRRAVYVDSKLKNHGFLTDMFKKHDDKQGILHKLKLIIPDSVKFSKIKDINLIDTANIAFETYDEAFLYFQNIALKKNINECLLTIALYYSENDSLKSKYLKEYCSKDSIKFKDYANNLLNNSLYSSLSQNNREIILLDNISFIEDHFYGYHDRLILAEQKSPSYFNELRKMTSKYFPEKEIIELSELSLRSLRTKMEYEYAILSTTFINSNDGDTKSDVIYFDSDEKPGKLKEFDLFKLNPSYWKLFKNNKLKAISYLKVYSFDDKTKLMKSINVINPYFWYTIIYRFCDAINNGSDRYAHRVLYYSYDISSKKSNFYSETTRYKMSKAYFLNSIYYAIKTNEKIIK
ncbi:MAG: M48 family metallopeptidase [Bacteroidales bacterium]